MTGNCPDSPVILLARLVLVCHMLVADTVRAWHLHSDPFHATGILAFTAALCMVEKIISVKRIWPNDDGHGVPWHFKLRRCLHHLFNCPLAVNGLPKHGELHTGTLAFDGSALWSAAMVDTALGRVTIHVTAKSLIPQTFPVLLRIASSCPDLC